MISIEYKVVSEFDVSRQCGSAEVLRRVGDGPWVPLSSILSIPDFTKLFRTNSLTFHELCAFAQVKEQIDADRAAAVRLDIPFSINGNRFFLNVGK